MLTVCAFAKVNLVLEVLGTRADGYHEVATVLQEIDLKDVLSIDRHSEIRVEPGEELVLRAATVLQKACGCKEGASISIAKGIPVAAGLGGSSSDAAATLRGLNELWGLGLSLGELAGLASHISSDTTFFLYGGTALGEGRGEMITPLPSFSASWVVLLRPALQPPPNKTRRLYHSLGPSHFTDGGYAARLAERLCQGGTVCETCFYNAFERVAFDAFPGLEAHWRRFVGAGAGNVHLAGSGPTLYALRDDRSSASRLCQSLAIEGLDAYLVETKARY